MAMWNKYLVSPFPHMLLKEAAHKILREFFFYDTFSIQLPQEYHNVYISACSHILQQHFFLHLRIFHKQEKN